MKNNQLTDLEIVKVFGLYPLCPVAVFDKVDPYRPVLDLVEGVIFDTPQVYCEHVTCDPKTVKLQLKPIHHISDQDLYNLTRLYDNTGWLGANGKTFSILPKTDEPLIKIIDIGGWPYSYRVDLRSGSVTMYKEGRAFSASDNQLLIAQWYHDNNFATPLYFGKNHWANGKTAIELDVAIPDRRILFDLLNKKFDNDKTEIGNWWLENEKLDINNLTVMDEVIDALKKELNV